MSRLKKLLEKIRRNPRAVRFDELDRVLRRAGFSRSQPSGGSSHYVYRKEAHKLTVPYRQPHVLEAYVLRAIKILEGMEEDEQ